MISVKEYCLNKAFHKNEESPWCQYFLGKQYPNSPNCGLCLYPKLALKPEYPVCPKCGKEMRETRSGKRVKPRSMDQRANRIEELQFCPRTQPRYKANKKRRKNDKTRTIQI